MHCSSTILPGTQLHIPCVAQLNSHHLLQEAAVAADKERSAALARLEEQDAQLADLGQQLATAICTCRSAAANELADEQAHATQLQVMQLRFSSRMKAPCSNTKPQLQQALNLLPWQASMAELSARLAAAEGNLAMEAEACPAPSSTTGVDAMLNAIAGKEEQVCPLSQRPSA